MHFNPSVRSIALVLCVSLCGVSSAAAAKRVVDPDGQGSSTNCEASNAAYTSIAIAIAAANVGDSIYICPGPGPYNEQVVVSKNNLKFIGILGATIAPSPMLTNTASLSSGNPIAAVILVPAGITTTIDQLTIDGSGHGISGCATNPMGIYFRNGSGTVSNSAVKNIRLAAGFGGCQAGNAIFAQSCDMSDMSPVPCGATGSSVVTVKDSTVHDFQKNGITGSGIHTTLTATGNRVSGDGATPNIAQNGIQIAFGALGTVSGNVVSDVVYSQCVDPSAPNPNPCNNGSSTGILVYQAGGVTNVTQNSVITTQTGVYLDADGSSVSQNDITHTLQYDGIYLTATSTGNIVAQNSVGTSDESAIWVDGTMNSITKNNLIEAPIGIHSCGGGNTIGAGSTKNTFYDIPVPIEATCMASKSSAGARATASPVD